jgi:selenide,water dikinase
VLRQLPPILDPAVLVGNSTNDDAAVYRLSAEQALVATVDYFTPIVDEPYDFGQIAAANALSDVYAMGARPIYALAICGFPRDRLDEGVLEEILRGGVEKASEAGIPVVGGHSIDDAEPKYGLAVTGIVHPDRIVKNVGARPGDRLFLTKPIGSGIVATAIKRGAADRELIRRAVNVMATLNRAASDAMLEVGVRAATDVTGFGLLGHLAEMTTGSGVAARVSASTVPVIEGARELAHADVVPGGTRRNHAGVAGVVRWPATMAEAEQLLLSDAQTSGGLLLAVAPERAEALRAALGRVGTLAAAEIGEIFSGDGWIEVVE